MKRIAIFVVCVMIFNMAVSQDTVTLRFTSEKQGGGYHVFDRVEVYNQTRGWRATLEYPDTVLTLTNITNSESAINQAQRPSQEKAYRNDD